MLNRRPARKLIAEINVVPYIDVMLVLLVIFLVTAPLLQQGVVVDLPRVEAQVLSPAEKLPIIASLDHQGHYFLNIADKPHDPIDKVAFTLRATAALRRDPKRRVFIKADEHVDYGEVVKLMVLLQTAGAFSVGLVTQERHEGDWSKRK